MDKDLREQLIIKSLFGELTEDEAVQLQKNKQAEATDTEIAFFADLIAGAEQEGERHLKAQLSEMEALFQQKKSMLTAPKGKGIVEKVSEAFNYTLDQLIDLFRPVPNYEAALALAHRSDAIQLLAPIQGIDCTDQKLTFQFEKKISQALEVQIENNRQQTILQTTIPTHQTDYTVDFANEQLHPGRYYWKLIGSEGTIIGVFFIQKDKMPAIS